MHRSISTPIFYVNASPHLGHLYSALLADSIARYQSIRHPQISTILVTGTDEHGAKISGAAGTRSVREHCDRMSAEFKSMCEASRVNYAQFIRTTEQRHRDAVWALWDRIHMNGFIYKGVFEGWYDQVQEAFVPKNKVREGMALEWRSEDNYLFRLSSQKDRVIQWIKDDNERIVPKFHRDEVLRMIESNGVMDHDLSISRLMKNMNWAIPVKNDPEHGIYVWFDALTNYLTACGFPNGHTNASGNITWPIDLHVIGKDILKFHTIYWPAFLAAAGIELPRKILVHSHWTRDGIKMSKSLGNVIHPQALFQTLGGVDQARYVVLRSGKIDRDSDFSMHAAIRIANDELADTFGNLVSRCLTLLPSHNRAYPSLWRDQMRNQEKLLEKQLNELNLAFMENFEKFKLPYAVDAILKTLSSVNAYFTENQPWHLVKSAKTSEEKEKLENILYMSIESCRIAAILLQPLMPSKMSSLLDHLGVPMSERSIDFAQVGKCSSRFISSQKMILFPRIK